MDSLVDYYSQRAAEYEDIYHRADDAQQSELAQITDVLQDTFERRRVLEVACGTGYWTFIISQEAKQVTGIDASDDMLAVAREKMRDYDNLRLERGDAYNLQDVAGAFDAGLANFWLSHVPHARLDEFLIQFHKRVGNGAVIFMADNMYVPGLGGDLVRPAGSDDTFKLRELKDGSSHRVLKNYYDEAGLRKILSPHARNLEVHLGRAYWRVRYEVG